MKKRFSAGALLLAAALLSTHGASAADVTPFVITGYIENFKLDNSFDPLTGATMKVNGTTVVVPRNLIVTMPATFLTPFDIFCLNPKNPGGALSGNACTQAPAESGLALNDSAPPLAPFEATIQGNIIGDAHIAGLVNISQEFLNAGAGYIKAIDLTNGEMIVGHDPQAPLADSDARVRLNDATGRHGRPMASPDLDTRFTLDTENPTVRATTGYPMCVPRGAGDGQCPTSNRPAGMTKFVMGPVGIQPPVGGATFISACPQCNQSLQAPFMVGDYINYSGTLAKDEKGFYISAHTVIASLGIYTATNRNPAYVAIDVALIGTLGPNIGGVPQEQQDRIKIEGFSTDPTRVVNIYAIDVDPSSGERTQRFLASTGTRLARFGQFRLVINKGAGVLKDFDGTVHGATREIMAQVASSPIKYVSPVGEFLFPENNVPGDPLSPLNFECLGFLQQGSGPLTTNDRTGGPTVGRLSPWPGALSGETSVFCGP